MFKKIKRFFYLGKKIIYIWLIQYHGHIPKGMWKHYLKKYQEEKRKLILDPNNEIEYKEWRSYQKINKVNAYPFEDYVLLSEKGVVFYTEMLIAIQKPQADIVYFDHDINRNGKRIHPSFKPVLSPDTLLGFNYIGYAVLVKKDLKDDYQKYHSLYRCYLEWLRQGKTFEHQSVLLYGCDISNDLSVVPKFSYDHHLQLILHKYNDVYVVDYPVRKKELVSIIIPMRDGVKDTQRCISSLLAKTNYPHYEIIIVDNGSQKEETFNYFKQIENDDRVNIFPCDIPFNFAKLNNLAAKKAKGKYLLFLNNDTEIMQSDWLLKMVGYAQQKWIGSVGCTLLYPDTSYQHAGVIAGKGGIAAHRYYRQKQDIKAYDYQLLCSEDVVACTAACLLVKTEVFQQVNGFNENLAVNYNDVDLAFRLLEKGYYNVYLPQVKLIHHESKSRGIDQTEVGIKRYKKEMQYMKDNWSKYLNDDPFYAQEWDKSCDYKLVIFQSQK